ncbi:MAG: FAD-dependent oxidoreductase [Rhizobacter sp.]
MKVCIIGAGLVGCASAYQLARTGFEVELIDAAAEPGLLTSFANGAQLSYSYAEPFASPGTLRSLPKMLLEPDSPVKFRLRADWRQWAWGLQFLAACRPGTARRGTAMLLQLAQLSRRVLEGWMQQERWSVGFVENGKLVLCPDEATFARQRALVAFQARLGCRQEVLSPAECRAREPALGERLDGVAGGIWTADECVADPYRLCRALVDSMSALGGRTSFNTRVNGFVREGRRIVAARTSRGDVSADAFVLAAGPHVAALASEAGFHLPVYPVKGYSITLPFRGEARPRASVTHLGRKTVFAPLGDALRVAAMAEITGYDMSIPESRVQAMIDSVEAVYPGMCRTDSPKPWSGLRPATPDSLPRIGRLASTNLFVNAGQGALGLTLAAGSAARLSDELVRFAA